MKSLLRSALVVIPCILLGSPQILPVAAQTSAARKPAGKQDIVAQVMKLLQAKLGDSIILKKIQETNTPVVLTTDQLIALKQAGASDAVMAALENPSSAASASGTSTTQTTTTVVPSSAPPAISPVTGNPVPPPPTVVTTSTTITTPPPPGGDKKRVAVDTFDYSTVKTSVAAVFGTNQDVGRGIQSLFVTRITKDNKMIVVERSKINNILAEQNFAASNRVKQGTGAKIGNIRGADVLLTGDIVAFGRDDRKKSAAIGGLGGGVFGAIAGSMKTDKAVVVVDYRLVDFETSEVIATGEARGESKRKSAGLGAIAGAFGVGGGGASFDMTSSNFAETIIGEATMDCVNKLAAILNEKVPSLEAKHIDIRARVAFANANAVTINAGSAQGVNVGDKFDVSHLISEIKDPQTHETIDLQLQKVGELTITQVKDRVSTGLYTGAAGVRIDDVVDKTSK